MPQIPFSRVPDKLDFEIMIFIKGKREQSSYLSELVAESMRWRGLGRSHILHQNTIENRVKRLIKTGYVQKGPKAGKRIRISLTPKGRSLMDELIGVFGESSGIQTLKVPAGTNSITLSTVAPLSVQKGADWVDIQIGSAQVPLTGQEVRIRFLDAGTEQKTPDLRGYGPTRKPLTRNHDQARASQLDGMQASSSGMQGYAVS